MSENKSTQELVADKTAQGTARATKDRLLEKSPYKRIFVFAAIGLTLLLLIAGFLGALLIISDGNSTPFQAIAHFILITWAIVFMLYFLWALYHYNINLGLTDEEWKEIYQEQRDKAAQGLQTATAEIKDTKQNPYKDETFGLPPGTVRGMIAFTLLFGAIAMLIASMGMAGEIPGDSFFWDHYEFFKTAFLMMIAFYFGDRSLKHLSQRWQTQPKQNKQKSPNAVDAFARVDEGEIYDFDTETPQPSEESGATDITKIKKNIQEAKG